jgi:hypothetical protein
MSAWQDPEAGAELEQSVIGALFQDNGAFDAAQPLSAAHFADPVHGAVFRSIAALLPAADPVTVNEHLGTASPGLPYLVQLEQCVPSARNVTAHARLLRDKAIRRALGAELARASAAALTGDMDAALSRARDALARADVESGAQSEAPELFRFVDLGQLGSPPEPQGWAWHAYMPAGHVTLLGGHGGAGKSTLALMVAACMASGRECFGKATMPARVCYFSGEDPAGLLLTRLARICRLLDLDLQQVRERLHILDASDADPVLFAELRANGVRSGATTPTYAALAGYIESHRIDVLIVDNASDVFDGDEIHRASVRAFVRSLVQLIRPHNGAVLLLAHVDKSTSRAGKAQIHGEAYSGSTAWHNSVRSRLYLYETGPGTFELLHQKSNLGPKAQPLALDWPTDGVFQVATTAGGMVADIAARCDTSALLGLIHEYTMRGEYVSTAPNSRANAQAFCRESKYPRGLKPADAAALLRNAERSGFIERIAYKGADRKPRERWGLTPKGLDHAGIAASAASAVNA